MKRELHFVNVMAGLGNQFYMFAYADYLARQGKNVKLYVPNNHSTGDTKDRTKRNINIDIPKALNFNFTNHFHTTLIERSCFAYKVFRRILLHRHIEPHKEWAVFHPINHYSFGMYNYHIGYFQSHHYIADDFRKKLSEVVGNLCSNQEKFTINSNDVALHIRRGDFLTASEIYHKIDTTYYIKALKELSNKMDIGKIFIFSDDFDAIKAEIEEISKIAQVVLVEGQSVLEDMNTLRQFQNYVLGNSTFAWWGAMLSIHQKPNVFVPKTPWKVEMQNASPYFPDWVQIENV